MVYNGGDSQLNSTLPPNLSGMRGSEFSNNKGVEEQDRETKLAETQMRIYKLYKDMIQNDMKKDKINALEALRRVREDNKHFISEYLEMQQENSSLKAAIKRYQGLVKNFDEEYESM